MNLFQIINVIKELCEGVPNINTVLIGDVYQLNSLPNLDYSAMVISQESHTVRPNDEYTDYTFNIFYVDRLTEDKSNKIDVENSAIQTLKYISNSLDELGFYINDFETQIFEERFEALCSGAYARIIVRVDNDECGNSFGSIYYRKDETYNKAEIDSKDTNTLKGANDYTDTQIAQKTYSKGEIDTKDEDTLNSANEYTDNAVKDKADKDSVYTKSEIDSKDENTLNGANDYTDTQIAQKTYSKDEIDTKDSNTLKDAKEYTDNAVKDKADKDSVYTKKQSDLNDLENLKKAKEYTDEQIAQIPIPDTYTKTEIDSKDSNTLKDAKEYTDNAVKDKADKSDLEEYNKTNNFKTINGETIIGTGDIVIKGCDVHSVNGQKGDVVLKTSDLENDSHYVTEEFLQINVINRLSDALSGIIGNNSCNL